jgi:hypothetical protein
VIAGRDATTGWMPTRLLDRLLEDVWRWLVDERRQLGQSFPSSL